MQCHRLPLQQHLQKKQGYTKEIFKMINWTVISAVGQALPPYNQPWLVKYIERYSATGRQMKRCNKWKKTVNYLGAEFTRLGVAPNTSQPRISPFISVSGRYLYCL